MGEILIPRRTKVEKGYELLADITVELAPVTNVDITGLNIGKGDEVVLVSDVVNPTGSVLSYRLFPNNNTTNTNYWFQNLQVNGTSVASGRANENTYVVVSDSSRSFVITDIKLTNNGFFVYQSQLNRLNGTSSLQLQNIFGASTFTAISITALNIRSETTNAIGIGSRFQLYKIGGA